MIGRPDLGHITPPGDPSGHTVVGGAGVRCRRDAAIGDHRCVPGWPRLVGLAGMAAMDSDP